MMKNKRLAGVLLTAFLGFGVYELGFCPDHQKVKVSLTGGDIQFAFDHNDLFCAKRDLVSLAGVSDAPMCDSFLPPYLLHDIETRNPFDKFMAHTISMTDVIEHQPLRLFANTDWSAANKSAKIEIYDAQGEERRPGVKARFEGDNPTGDKEVDACYDFNVQIRKFYKDIYGRNSIDGKGMKLITTVNFGNGFNNAFWDGVQVTFGRPGQSSPFQTFVLMDIAGHEITHGVTQKDSNLIYYGQPGALNESLSDVFGALVVQYTKKQSAKQANWLVGDGIWKKEIKGRALRDMMNPGTAYDDPKVGKDPQPAHMKDYIKTRADNGGVHYNSGIPNRAFVNFAREVGGNAWEKPGKIWYKARALAGKNPSFAQFAHHTVEAAKQLGYEGDVEKLTNAWLSVGVTPSASAGDTDTPKMAPGSAPHSDIFTLSTPWSYAAKND